jgi:hypothetical protein
MQTKYINLKKIIPIAISGIFLILLSACGTHNNGQYSDADGIYSSQNSTTDTEVVQENESDKANYYKQYFNSKNGTYSDLPEEGAIFTDIDAYSTSETLDENGYVVIEEEEYNDDGYGAWGSNSESVSINIYNNGGYNYGYWHRPYWWYGSAWGYNNYWYGPSWGIGYGWGYPYYGTYCYGFPYYSGYYYNPYYYGYNGYGYYGYSNVAYNRGRRNTDYIGGRTNSRGRSNISANRDSYSRSELGRRSNSNARRSNLDARNNNSVFSNRRSTRPNVNSTTRPSRPNVQNTRPSRPNVQSTRPSRPSFQSNRPSGNNNISRPSTPSRNSSIRSSGGGTRSSGSTRGGGRRGGGGLQ